MLRFAFCGHQYHENHDIYKLSCEVGAQSGRKIDPLFYCDAQDLLDEYNFVEKSEIIHDVLFLDLETVALGKRQFLNLLRSRYNCNFRWMMVLLPLTSHGNYDEILAFKPDGTIFTPYEPKIAAMAIRRAINHIPQIEGFFVYKHAGTIRQVEFQNIFFFEKFKNIRRVKIYYSDGGLTKEEIFNGNLNEIEDYISENCSNKESFSRCYTSFIVNIYEIDYLKTPKEILMKNGETILLGRTFSNHFLKQYQTVIGAPISKKQKELDF